MNLFYSGNDNDSWNSSAKELLLHFKYLSSGFSITFIQINIFASSLPKKK